MWSWYTFWLILHILAVFAAFGPTFAYGLIATLGQKHPEHADFATRIILTVDRRMVLPLAVVVPVFGVALILTADFDLWQSEWLLIAISLYIVAFAFQLLVQTPTTARLVRAQEAARGGRGGEDAKPGEIESLARRLQLGGTLLGMLVLVILVLMVWKPGSCQGVC